MNHMSYRNTLRSVLLASLLAFVAQTATAHHGWSGNTAGETVTVQGQRNEDMQMYEAKVRRVIWNGKEFDVYPPK